MALPKSKVKVKKGENLTEANIAKVFALYTNEKTPIPWKDACDILNIAHNKPRLTKIMDNYKAEQEDKNRRKAANRGKPATAFEISASIEQYLSGDSVSVIADRLNRGASFVKAILDKVGVPSRVPGITYWNPEMIPESCIKDRFELGDIVWSARYNAAGIITKKLGFSKKADSEVYELYINQPFEEPSPYFANTKGGFYACQPVYELGSLEHLKEYGINLSKVAENA